MEFTEGMEGDVRFVVCPVGNLVSLDVENIETGHYETRVYKCIYNPVCGHDALDVQNVENELNSLIELVKGE